MGGFLLGPNPFDQSFTIAFTSEEPTMATIQIVNKAGKVVNSDVMPVEAGKNKYDYTDGKSLASGNYIIRISNPMEIHTLTVTKK
jgi:hypothetical protein